NACAYCGSTATCPYAADERRKSGVDLVPDGHWRVVDWIERVDAALEHLILNPYDYLHNPRIVTQRASAFQLIPALLENRDFDALRVAAHRNHNKKEVPCCRRLKLV